MEHVTAIPRGEDFERCFKIVEDKYLLSININFSESVDFIFYCDSVEWLPIKLVTADELDTIK